MYRRLSTVLASILLCVLSGCGNSTPSDEQAKQAWLAGHGKFLTQDQPGELVSFVKLDGVGGEAFGVKVYQYQYEARLRCKEDWSFGFGQTEPYACKAGDIVVARGRVVFQKTEKGWVSK